MQKWTRFYLPGAALILLAFFSGSQTNVVIGLFGFLSFFTIGVTLILEGRKRKGNE